LRNKIKRSLLRPKRAISPVVSTLLLIIVAVGSVTAFAYILTGFQTQAEKENDTIQNARNEDLQIANLQLYPPNWDTVDVTGMNFTIRNANTQLSGLVGVEINGNYSAFATIGNSSQSPYSVLMNGQYVQINQTQIIEGKQTLQMQVNLSMSALQQPIPRTSPINIVLLTAAQNVFTFTINPPVADFNAQDISPGDDLLNASGSFSPDTGIQVYNWNFVGLNYMGGVNSTSPTLTGPYVQYFPVTETSLVTLTVVDDYGLTDQYYQVIPNSGIIQSLGQGNFGNSPNCGVNETEDMALFVCPNISNLEGIREVLMSPYTGVYGCEGHQQCYGFDPDVGINNDYGLSCGGNVEPSLAINVHNGYNNLCVLTDNNIEGGYGLDYFNSADSILTADPAFGAFNAQYYAGVMYPNGSLIYNAAANDSLATNILVTTRAYLAQPFDAIGPCQATFNVYNYPSSFQTFDRREGEYGFNDPYIDTLVQYRVGILGTIGSLAYNNNVCQLNPPYGTPNYDDGQLWYAASDSSGSTTSVIGYPQYQAQPLIVAELPGVPIVPGDDLEELSFLIDQLFYQCVAGTAPCTGQNSWQYVYQHYAMTQYPFQAPREALHFIQVTRATQAWNLTGITVKGLSPLQMLQIAIAQVFTPASETGPMGYAGATGPDGGLYQQWGGGGSANTPEPNMQAMIAFDPQMPTWFTWSACNSLYNAVTFPYCQ
jgi:hypothetical protein